MANAAPAIDDVAPGERHEQLDWWLRCPPELNAPPLLQSAELLWRLEAQGGVDTRGCSGTRAGARSDGAFEWLLRPPLVSFLLCRS